MDEILIHTPDFQISQLDFIIRLLVGVGIGLLIGLEREHAALPKKVKPFAGMRTFTLVIVLAFLTMTLNYLVSPWILPITLMGVFGLIGLSYFISARDTAGGTTEISVFIAFFLGILTFLGFIELALAITIIVVGILSSKISLQSFVGKVTNEEIFATIRFGVIALLILPFLPDEPIDPYGAIRLREVGLMVLLTSGLNFVGYILMRVFGKDYGILLTGIVGGIVSSTMITWIFAKKSKEQPLLATNCIAAIMAASTVMVLRILVWVFLFNKQLFTQLLIPGGVLFLSSLGTMLYFHFKQRASDLHDVEMPLGKPLNLRTALFFAVLYVSILFIINFSNDHLGDSGIYLTTAIASLTDVNAITISLTRLAGVSLSFNTVLNAIILATLCNTIIKIGIALWAGSKELRKLVTISYGIIFLSGIVSFMIINLT